MKKLFPLLVLALLLGTTFYVPKIAHAQTTNYTATYTWDAISCTGTVSAGSQNGQAIWIGAASGDTINLNIVNSSSTQNLQFSVSNEGSATTNFAVAPNGTTSKSYTVPQNLDLFVQSTSPTCTSQPNNYSHLYFLAGSGTLTCTISGNKVWNLAGTFTNVTDTTLYRGSTYVQHYTEKGNSTTIDGTQFAAQSTPQTYYLYNGSDPSASLIGTVTCPATTAAAASTPTTTTPAAVSTPTTTTPTSTVAPTTTTSTPKKTTHPQFTAMNTSVKHPAPSGGLWAFFIATGVLGLLGIISTWKAFQKAGRHGWEAIIPVYNTWTIFELGGKPGWWALLMLIPFVNFVALVVLILAELEVAKRFGKTALFGFFGLFVFGFIGWTILAFSDAKYTIPAADSEAGTPTDPGMPESS